MCFGAQVLESYKDTRMIMEQATRKLSALLSADVKGYSRLMGDDELSTVETLKKYREVMSRLVMEHRGRVVDSPGDNLLAQFSSVVDAVQSAVAIQKELEIRNARLPETRRLEFRIGINLGDVIEDEGRVYGDGVNIAARIEALAEAGGICVSGTVYDQVKNKLELGYESQGEQKVKNIQDPVRVYRVLMEPKAAGSTTYKRRRDDPRHRRKAVGITLVALLVLGILVLVVYRFYLRPPASSIERASVEKMAFPLPARPSIAVLPFDNMSGDPEQEYFSDGLTEDLITDLSKFSGMFVISRNSVFRYKGKPVRPKDVSEALGVRYILEGSVRKSGDRVRITAQLIDAVSGGHLWAERYDRELKDIFKVQDELTQQIVSALEVSVRGVEQERALHKVAADLNAFDYELRGWWHYRRFTRSSNEEARRMFSRAVALDPTLASAHAGLGFTYTEQWAKQWGQDPDSLKKAFELAKKAITLNDELAGAYILLSHVYLWRKQHTQAIAELKKALELHPNHANSYADMAELMIWTGRPEEALVLVKKAMRLNPHYPVNYLFTLGFARTMTQNDRAVDDLKRVLTLDQNHWGAHILLAGIYGTLDQWQEARSHVTEALQINPQLSIEVLAERIPFKDEIRFAHFADTLRRAGLAEK